MTTGAYAEHPARVPGAVVWTRTADGGSYRVLPDGCMDLLWIDGRLVVAGPDQRAYVQTTPAGTRFAAVRFGPGTAPAFLGVPARVLVDQRVPLADLWTPARARRLTDRIHRGSTPAAGLEQVIADAGLRPDRLTNHVADAVRRGMTVRELATGTGISERQLRRHCLNAFGYGPKTLDRILRLQQVVEQLRTGVPLATLAATARYADQAHLSREVKALTDLTPRQLRAN